MELLEFLLHSVDQMRPGDGIALAALEALLPPIPLTAVVGVNVVAFGALRGFFYSWLGTCTGSALVFWAFGRLARIAWVAQKLGGKKLSRATRLVEQTTPLALFLILMLPFTPSALVNFAFGISGYSKKRFLKIMLPAKVVMVGLLSVFGSLLAEAVRNPYLLIFSALFLALLYILSRKVRGKDWKE
ncbi:MAG: TVP38/TMEM64 family protein [Stomatobaculum sp.]